MVEEFSLTGHKEYEYFKQTHDVYGNEYETPRPFLRIIDKLTDAMVEIEIEALESALKSLKERNT